ncbi:MAG: peptide ABC transporter substrate-binding protein [Candidatus Eremiobacteraeota bacterium]|nr:peptide ABC transporter substrate-binding protein [Candidatus Eremiobacteraeota bacterium]
MTELPTYANGGISKDGKTIILHFRTGVTWSDGFPVTARDLLFTYKLVMDDRTNPKLREGWDDIHKIELRGDYTAAIRLREPNADVLGTCFGAAAYPPLPEHLLKRIDPATLQRGAYAAKPVGDGPFMLEAWNHGASLEFVANPHYWRGQPKLERITWKVIPNSETLFTQLQSHEIDLYDGVTPAQIPRLRNVTGIRVTHRIIANLKHLQMNTARPNLQDVRVRLAIAEAVDWDRINEDIYHGYNLRARSDIPPDSWAAPDIPFYRHDPADARRLLDAAGWRVQRDGYRYNGNRRLTIEISSATGNQPNEQAEVQIQSHLRTVGIDMRVRNYPVSLLFARDGPLYSGKYDTSWSTDTQGPDPDNEGSWNSAFIPPRGANTSWLNDPAVNQTSDAQLRTYDRRARKTIVQKEEARLHELVPAVFLYWENGYAAFNDDFHNYKPAEYFVNAWNAWEWDI